MGLFNLFKKKKTIINNNNKVKNPPIINELNKLYSENKYDEIILLVTNNYKNSKPPLEVKKILLLAYYYIKEYDKSLELAQDVALTLNDVASWFNVLSVLMALNKPKQGEEIFNKILKIHNGVKTTGTGNNFIPQLSIQYIRYYYANMLTDIGMFADALTQLEILTNIYCNIKITDATFLYIRGIPFFEDYSMLLKRVCEGLHFNIKQSEIVIKLLSAVDSNGKTFIKKNIL